jgi:hypothetical protein
VGYIKEKGIYAFHNKYCYGLRSLVEAQIPRIKRCIGERLLTQKIASQENEGVVIAHLVTCGTRLAGAFASTMDSCVRNTPTHTHPNKAQHDEHLLFQRIGVHETGSTPMVSVANHIN